MAQAAWLTPEGRSPALLRLTAAGCVWQKRGCGSTGMADVQVMWNCSLRPTLCRERLADVEESVAERRSEVHRQLQRVCSPSQVRSAVVTASYL